MKSIWPILRGVGVAWCVGLLFLPYSLLPNNVRAAGTFVWVFATILWIVLYPQGMLEPARTARPNLNPQDKRLQQIQRIAGVIFLVLIIVIVAVSLRDSR
jgi:hypothetical protein